MSDQVSAELINKINELQQEAKEHILVLDAFKAVEPERKCFRMIGGVLVERTVAEIKPSLEDNLKNIEKAIETLNETLKKRQAEKNNNGSMPEKHSNVPQVVAGASLGSSTGVLA